MATAVRCWGPPGWIARFELLLLEVAEMLGRDLAHLVVCPASQPSWEVDGLRLCLGEAPPDRQTGPGGGEAVGRRRWS